MEFVLLIKEQIKQYAVCNKDFNEIQWEMTIVGDSYGFIAPYTWSLQQQDQAEGNQDLHTDFNESFNLSVDLNTEPLILNKEQKEFYHALNPINYSTVF